MSGVESPCVSICLLDENDICKGCYRSVYEVMNWGYTDDEEKRAILERCNERQKKQEGSNG